MRHKYLYLLLFVLGLSTPVKVLAQNTLVELENTLSTQDTYSIDATYTSFVSTNAYLPNRSEHQSGQDHLLTGRLHLPGKYMLSTSLWFNQDFNNERKLLARDSVLTLTKPLGKLGDNVNVIARAGATLPLSKASNETNGLITAFRINPLFSINASGLIEGLSLIYRPTFIYNIHEYETSLTGNSNQQYTINQRITVLYPLLKNLYLSLDNTYVRSWTYKGNANDFYSLDQSLSTNFTKSFSGFMGHSIGGNALNVNGQESDIRIFDTRVSSYYIGISYQF